MLTAEFFVHGVPTPQGSKSAWVNPKTGRAVIIDGGTTKTQKAHKTWRRTVHEATQTWIAENEPWLSLDEPVKVRLHFLMPPITTQPNRVMHATKPDVDKLVRAVFDSLTSAGLVRDDSRFCTLEAIKEYAECEADAGCLVSIFALGRVERTLSTARRMTRLATVAR